MQVEWKTFEAKLRANGVQCVCGVDEAGRGPLAGPVYAAAVILPPDCVIDGLNDSKKLTEKKREARTYEQLSRLRGFGGTTVEIACL